MNVIGIIPARYASSRFPGKPLARIGRKTMIERVYTRVANVLSEVAVATDDQRIFDCVEAFGGRADGLADAWHPRAVRNDDTLASCRQGKLVENVA